jgi:hypothetical protein
LNDEMGLPKTYFAISLDVETEEEEEEREL